MEWTEGGEVGLENGCSRVQSGDDMTKDQSAGEGDGGKSSGRQQLHVSVEQMIESNRPQSSRQFQ